ncbi:MAG: hypothetical protein GTN49_06475 [candidate division Zixibacteria bacterium]|nr:hypothetical protein [candidate division Zixibacteria bacterium]
MNWWFEDKLRKWAFYIGRLVAPDVKDKIMAGYEDLFPDAGLDEVARWMKAATERMTELLDEKTRANVMTCFACEFPSWRVVQLRELYEEAGSVDAVVALMKEDPSTYGPTERRGDTIVTTKVPFDEEKFNAATTAEERRQAYCHCHFAKAMEGDVPSAFCYCGAGWDRMLWEGILGKPVEVEVRRSVMQGDDVCEFVVHLPER